MPDSTLELLLDRYLAGEAGADEIARLQAWANTPERVDVLTSLQQLRGGERFVDLTPEAIQRARTSVLARVTEEHARGSTSNHSRTPVVPRHVAWPWMTVAGAALSLIVAMWWTNRPASRNASHNVPRVQYATGIGQRATVTLDDGTHVLLAPQSRLRVAADFGGATRTVSLTGEAYFTVARVTGAPFVVQTDHSTMRVLGTAFDVQAYPLDGAARVTVRSGKVAITSERDRAHVVALTAGMGALIPDSSGTIAVSDMSRGALWVDGRMAFHDAPVTTVLAAMSRWYGYQFRVNDSTLAGVRLTLDLSTESAQTALRTLEDVMHVTFTFDHDVIVVSPRRAMRVPARTHDPLISSATEVGR